MSYSSKQVVWIEVEPNLNLDQNCKSTGKISYNYTHPGLAEKGKKTPRQFLIKNQQSRP